MNILNNALNHITTLIANQLITLEVYEIQSEYGMASKVLSVSKDLYSHIQPISPFELKKYTDSTLDSNKAYKFFFCDDNAKVIHSLDLPLQDSVIKWNDKHYKIYAIRDWFIQNGWVAVYATLSENDDDNKQDII